MGNELENIDPKAIEAYNDFVNSLDNYDMSNLCNYEDNGLSKRILKKFIFGLLVAKNDTVGVSINENDGEIKISGIGKRIHKNILWIKENLDIWDIIELPYDNNGHHKYFEFKWRNDNELEKKKNK